MNIVLLKNILNCFRICHLFPVKVVFTITTNLPMLTVTFSFLPSLIELLKLPKNISHAAISSTMLSHPSAFWLQSSDLKSQ